MDADALSTALDVSVRIASAGLCLTALEVIADRRSYADDGIFGPTMVLAVRGNALPAVLRPPAVVVALAATQLLASAVVLGAGPYTALGRAAVGVSLVTLITLHRRRVLGGDGAEQMSTLIVAATAAAVLPSPQPARIAMAVAFLAAQAALSYTTAGVAKLVSPLWRSGVAVAQVLDTYGHGHARAADFLRARPRMTRAATAAVLLVEVPFALLVLGPRPLVAATLGAAFAFHVACAFLMGLNGFLWAFPATYPCVWAIPALFG